jgi:hypothetical protein
MEAGEGYTHRAISRVGDQGLVLGKGQKSQAFPILREKLSEDGCSFADTISRESRSFELVFEAFDSRFDVGSSHKHDHIEPSRANDRCIEGSQPVSRNDKHT